MAVIECQACGRRLDLPADFPEAGDFACAHCGLWMRNVEAARAFRWATSTRTRAATAPAG